MPFWTGGDNRRGHSGNGVPNRRPSGFARGLIHMGAAEYNTNRERGRRANQNWRGSSDEKEVRGGSWFTWGKK